MMKTPHILLAELETLGITLSTDGIQLSVDAPTATMTTERLRDLAEQKSALIPLLLAAQTTIAAQPAPASQDQENKAIASKQDQENDDALYTFASTISHIVDVLGGSDQVTLTKHEPGLTLARYLQTHRLPYRPATLPRACCPHHVLILRQESHGTRVLAQACQGETLVHGWCAEHARSHDLLCLGAQLGYPSLRFLYREIGQGVEQWEAYAECATGRRLDQDIAHIQVHIAAMKGGDSDATAVLYKTRS